MIIAAPTHSPTPSRSLPCHILLSIECFFLHLVEPNKYCPYAHGCKTIHWSMRKLPGAISLKKTDSWYSRKLQLPKLGKNLNPRIYNLPQPVPLLTVATATSMYNYFCVAQRLQTPQAGKNKQFLVFSLMLLWEPCPHDLI